MHFLRFLILENADAFQILGGAVFSSRMRLLCQNVLLDKHLLKFGGFLGGWWQQKAASFLSLVFIAQALANMKNLENDLKQIVMALT